MNWHPDTAGAREKLAYTTAEACDAIGIRRSKLFEMIATGELKAKKLGAKTLIPADELRALVARLPEAA